MGELDARVTFLENQARELNLCLGPPALAVTCPGLRLVAGLRGSENSPARMEARLQAAETREAYCHQPAGVETTKPRDK